MLVFIRSSFCTDLSHTSKQLVLTSNLSFVKLSMGKWLVAQYASLQRFRDLKGLRGVETAWTGGQVKCVFSTGFASLIGLQFQLWLLIMQPCILVLPEVCQRGKPWDKVYMYSYSKCCVLSVRDQMRLKRTWQRHEDWVCLSQVLIWLYIKKKKKNQSTHLFN